MIRDIDTHGNKKINYTEFLMATSDIKILLDDGKLNALFGYFDTDNDGLITETDIVTAMKQIGHQIT